jgi:hypothetical protein
VNRCGLVLALAFRIVRCGDLAAEAPSRQPDAMPVTACVDPTVGATCSEAARPCQPANPCATGYIWSCIDTLPALAWFHELITCSSQPNGTAPTTSACPDGEILFVDDVAGDGCILPAADSGACPTGLYLSRIRPPCCSYPTQAWCVPTPAACHDELSL